MNSLLCLLAQAAPKTAQAGAKAIQTAEPIIDWSDKRTQLIAAVIGVILLVIVVKVLIEIYHRIGPIMPLLGSLLFVGLGIFFFQMLYNKEEPDWARPLAEKLRLFLPRKEDAQTEY